MKSLIPKVYLGITSTIIVNLFYFIWQPYEKCIIDLPLRETWLPDIITNILYLLIYFGWLIMLFFTSMNKSYIFSPVKTVAKMFGALLLLQIPFELIKLVTKIYISEFRFVVGDVCSAAGVFVGLLVLFKISNTNISIKSKRFIFLAFGLISLIIVIQVIRNCAYIDVEYAKNKYIEGSEFIKAEENNYRFICEALSFICEIIASSLIFVTFLFKAQKCSETESKKDENPRVITKIITYTMLLLASVAIILPTKMLVLPHSSLATITGMSLSLPQVKGEPDSQLDRGFENKSINRYISRKDTKSVYSISKISFGSNNVVFHEFKTNYIMDSNLPNELHSLEEYSCTSNGENIVFYTYSNELLIIKTQLGYRFIELKDINGLQEDAIVTECIKHMINEGVFSYFEYGCDYLKKYDNSFIKPYIERYSEGKFVLEETENAYNTDIKGTYIQKVASELR